MPATSLSLFWLYGLLSEPRQEGSINVVLVMIHYGIAVIYSIFLFVGGFWKFRRDTYVDGRPARWGALLLWLISAYALNREIVVFQESTAWLCVALGIVGPGIGLMAFAARPAGFVAPFDPPVLRMISAAGEMDYTQKRLANGTVQLTAPNTLIYLKPQPDWFSADHSPMVCWQGSGYDLRHVRETMLNNHPAYVAELVRNGQPLQTAWWFTNGKVTTISQLTLRGQMLRGETGFGLVNVTREK